MRYDWLDAYLLQKKGVTKDLQADWNWIRYPVSSEHRRFLLGNDNQHQLGPAEKKSIPPP